MISLNSNLFKKEREISLINNYTHNNYTLVWTLIGKLFLFVQCRKKQVYVERVGQLQRALSSLQASSDRREETERQLRGQLERELREGGGGGNGNEQTSSGETIADLKRRLRERDEKIMSLEGDVAKWEQRYLEESALRQAAIDAASLPK